MSKTKNGGLDKYGKVQSLNWIGGERVKLTSDSHKVYKPTLSAGIALQTCEIGIKRRSEIAIVVGRGADHIAYDATLNSPTPGTAYTPSTFFTYMQLTSSPSESWHLGSPAPCTFNHHTQWATDVGAYNN